MKLETMCEKTEISVCGVPNVVTISGQTLPKHFQITIKKTEKNVYGSKEKSMGVNMTPEDFNKFIGMCVKEEGKE